SDISSIPGASLATPATDCSISCPTVTVGFNGLSPQTFLDSTHTLDTLGFDYASVGNESFDWRIIGSCSGPGCGGTVGGPRPIAGAGLPGLIAACGGLLALARRRRQLVA